MVKESNMIMDQWIELNLPYSFYETFDIKLKAPNLNARAKKELGFTQREVEDLYKALPSIFPGGEDYSKMSDLSDEINDKVKEKFPEEESGAVSSEVRELRHQERIKLHARSKNAHVRAMGEWLNKRHQYRNWEDVQPEIISFNEKWDTENKAAIAEQNKKSFSGLDLDNPGTLIEVEVDGQLSQYLIGDINPNAGVCDDCVAFDKYKAIVKRYKIIWLEGK